MGEARFTPGPWELVNGGDIFGPLGGDSGDGVKADDNDGWQIAEVGHYPAFVGGEETELGAECRRANAHLVAAAPELYEALEALLEDGVWAGCDWIPSDGAKQKAEQALSKARGE